LTPIRSYLTSRVVDPGGRASGCVFCESGTGLRLPATGGQASERRKAHERNGVLSRGDSRWDERTRGRIKAAKSMKLARRGGSELDCSTGSAGHGYFGDRRKDSSGRRGSGLVRFTARWSVKLGAKAAQVALQDAGGQRQGSKWSRERHTILARETR
jgi:hypothetical protein